MNCYSEETISIPGLGKTRVYRVSNIIIGSGAAGLNCAEHLADSMQDLVVLTTKLGGGTSRNSGSDKQTYYKLGLFGEAADCPMDMARALFKGGMMHGDHAYIEALESLPEFFHLVRNGVPFPHNRYGAYVGYKTDHDPRQRATSAGPKTSAFMVDGFLRRLKLLNVPIFDDRQVIRILKHGDVAAGVLTLNKKKLSEKGNGLEIFLARNVILATGGPGELFKYSVFPKRQVGALGVALQSGAVAGNLTEWQFGLASTSFRWNLSGSYQQVIPCYFSRDEKGGDENGDENGENNNGGDKYFLNDIFPDMKLQASRIFLKGYQWPFHAPYLCDFGSSLVDLAVWEEIQSGRKVFLDFQKNPVGNDRIGKFSLDNLEPAARNYLERSGALGETPFNRLSSMNSDAISIYQEHGIDISKEPLECAVCAQHINGGLCVNLWWETSVKGLFAIGEVAGTHGVRPGGSALNAGQAGGLRASEFIRYRSQGPPPSLGELTGESPGDFTRELFSQVKEAALTIQHYSRPGGLAFSEVKSEIQDRMFRAAGFIRNRESVSKAVSEAADLRKKIVAEGFRSEKTYDIVSAFEAWELAFVSEAVLRSLQFLFERGGGSRGSYVVTDKNGAKDARSEKGSHFRFLEENLSLRKEVGEICFCPDGRWNVKSRQVRPLPVDNSWYETEWRRFKEGKVFE